MNPLISCLMVTQPGREALIRKAIACYRRQTYEPRELVIVHDASADEPSTKGEQGSSFEQFIRTEAPFARIVRCESGQSLGELRNVAIEEARGAFVCQWDDDDQYHPDRLLGQWEALRGAEADACFLASQCHYFAGARHLYVRDTGRRGIEGTVMHRRDLPVRYPSMGKEEDTVFMGELKANHRTTLLQGVPWLYLRVFHGGNTWNEDHHRRMMQSTWDVDLLRTQKREIENQLAHFDVERPVTVRGRDGRAFSIPGKGPTILRQRQSADDLAVVCCHFNPVHYRSRLRNYHQFAAAFAGSDVRLLTVELAFGDDPWELPAGDRILQIRTRDVMWQKECLLNRGIGELIDEGYEKIAWVDADVWFHDPAWPVHASIALEDHRLIQLFESVHRVQPIGPPQVKRGSAARFCTTGRIDTELFTPGYGWAARADVLGEVPLCDSLIVGGGDAAVFLASCGRASSWKRSLARQHWFRSMNLTCRRHYVAWAKRWAEAIDGRVGYLDQHASTFYHGSRKNRRFQERWSLIADFDPNQHVTRCPEGCWQWVSDDTAMKRNVCNYFRDRAEDAGEALQCPLVFDAESVSGHIENLV